MIAPRRAFLRGLAALPLIGGGVAIIGQPTAVGVPVTEPLLDRYADWLATEYGECLIELAAFRQPEDAEHATRYRREWCRENLTLNPDPSGGRFVDAVAIPSSARAALVLSAVGMSWKEPSR